ncbi:MAG: beta-galactosidase, partial [Phocaeicola sp.]|nr:beta-galactosidase [Phocaeicola sp.]
MKVKHTLFILGTSLFSLAMSTPSWAGGASERTYTLPSRLEGVSQPVLSLNGNWDFRYLPSGRWTSIQVPGEAAMQGFAIEHDKPFFYKKTFIVPADFINKRVILRFDGVYSHAKLSVNGKLVREHHGGFTRWETDITSLVHIGKKNEIQLEITDRLDDISYASGYAHHPVGGILRDVTLFAVPESYLYDMNVETHLDSLYQNAELRFSCEYAGEKEAELKFRLEDAQGKEVHLTRSHYTLKQGANIYSLPVKNPLKWDAEHPNLYTLEVIVCQNDKESFRFSRHVGFREVKIVKDRMLVNGQPVKLRGACRHDIHPTLGRTTTAELDSLDALLFKQSNMNFVRTSHYPPTERFLDFCDRYGIYVESETAVCFVDTYRQKNYAPGRTQDDPSYT